MINDKFDDFDPTEWGNTSLPGFSNEQLMNPNLNYVLANLARNKDPKWLEKQEQIYKSPKFKKLIAKLSKKKWSDPEFQAKQHIARILAWANNPKRREQVVEQFSQPKTKSHKRNIGKSLKAFNKTPEGQKLIAERAEKQRGVPKPKFTCPVCGNIGGPIMKRWHFENCKNK
jgi:ribosomal protein L34